MPITIVDPIQLTAGLGIAGPVIADGSSRVFKAAGAHNDTGATVTLTVHLVPKGGNPDTSNRLISRAVANNKTDMCPELLGRGLSSGGTLQVSGAGLNFGYTAIDTITG